MIKNRAIELSIPTPCSQNWDEMTVNEKGHFCENCNKSVVDFTNYNDQQLVDFFKKSTGNICGQFRDSQLEKKIYTVELTQNRFFPQFLISAILAIGLGNNAYAKGKHIDPIVSNVVTNREKKEGKNNSIADDNTHSVIGEVTDLFTKEEIPGVKITIEGSDIATTTNMLGLFQLVIPDHLPADKIRLIVSSPGYISKTLSYATRNFPSRAIIELQKEEMHQFSGKIIDHITKEEMPGVTILVEGTVIAAASDIQGVFKLDVPGYLVTDTVKLIISSIGYITKTVRCTAQGFPLNTTIELVTDLQNRGFVSFYREPRTVGGINIRHPFWHRLKRWFGIKNKWR